MWQRQMEPQVTRVERPEMATSQLTKGTLSESDREAGRLLLTDGSTSGSGIDVGKGSPRKDEDSRPEGTGRLVNVGEDLGGEAGLGESSESTGSGIDTGETDGEHGNADGGIHKI